MCHWVKSETPKTWELECLQCGDSAYFEKDDQDLPEYLPEIPDKDV